MAETKDKNLFACGFDDRKIFSLKGKYSSDWVEESFDTDLFDNRNATRPINRKYLGSSFNGKKFIVLLVLLGLVFLLLILRMLHLQIVNGAQYKQMAEDNSQRLISIPAERGLIYDRNGIQLTKNIPNFSISLMPQYLPREATQRIEVIERLSVITGESEDSIERIFKRYGSYSYESIIIKEDIDYETALRILIDSSDLPGIQIQRGSKRLYLSDLQNFELYESKNSVATSLAHILGYQGKLSPEELDELYKRGYLPFDYIGKAGIEKNYEYLLRGNYGTRKIEVDAMGKERAVISQEPPRPGEHIKLTIDVKIQKALEDILKKSLLENEKSRGAAIALDPADGSVLALVSLPAFNNNHFSGGISTRQYNEYIGDEDNPLFNRAIAGTYPPGSTIKPALAAAALNEGIINSRTGFLSTGGITVGPWFFPDWLPGGHGNTNARKSIAWSVNTFYYYIGGGHNDFIGLGVARITDYLRRFGFGTKLGIDLSGEANGFLPSKDWKEKNKGERWYVGDTYNLSIGQGDLLVTPLQITAMTATFANGGTLYKPKMVDSVVEPVSGRVRTVEKEILNDQFINQNHIKTVRLGMKDCVDSGTCQILSALPFSAAGKTGTAQWSSVKDTHAWFTSFAPFNDPQIVITILIEEGGEGGIVAIPPAYEFYNWWWKYVNGMNG